MPGTITTNYHPRSIIDASELTPKEREEFDYLNWEAIERGEDTASFFRYKGMLHDIAEFSTDWGITRGMGLPDFLKAWDAYRSDSFWSGMVIRIDPNDSDYVIVGRFVTS